MDYRAAYEQLVSALFKYAQEHDDAYVCLMLEMRRIENNLGKCLPPIKLHHPSESKDE